MDIGKRIKEIRVGKLMTQSQLAGDEITRNMLSRIENGAALPSLGTVMYLASRLGVPAGVLLSEDDNEYNFKRSGLIRKIRDSYSRGELELCLDMCEESDSEEDDEICYIAANCSIRLAEESVILGHLYSARTLIENAVSYAKRTVYDVSGVISKACVLIDFLRGVSPMLDLELDVDMPLFRAKLISASSSFCRYISVLKRLDEGGADSAWGYLSQECDCKGKYSDLYCKHVEAKIKMLDGEYEEATKILISLLDLEGMTLKLLVYLLIKDLEVCYRETEDFRGAYESSSTKLGLIESMLSEVDRYAN